MRPQQNAYHSKLKILILVGFYILGIKDIHLDLMIKSLTYQLQLYVF